MGFIGFLMFVGGIASAIYGFGWEPEYYLAWGIGGILSAIVGAFMIAPAFGAGVVEGLGDF